MRWTYTESEQCRLGLQLIFRFGCLLGGLFKSMFDSGPMDTAAAWKPQTRAKDNRVLRTQGTP